MEHLPLPKDVASPGPTLVPYVCREAYDGGPFSTYSSRRKGPDALEPAKRSEYTNYTSLISMPIAELEEFLQTWLFFGLLEEVFKELFIPSAYVTEVRTKKERGLLSRFTSWLAIGQRRILTTSQLVPMVEAWMKQVQLSTEAADNQRAQYEHIAECLRVTSVILQAVRSSMRPDFNPVIRSCLASVGELLEQAANQAYGIENLIEDNLCPGTWWSFYDFDQGLAQMKDNGICPFEIHRVRYQVMTLQTHHYWTWMQKGTPSTRHQNCTDTACRANYSNLGEYVGKHRYDDCQCTNFSIDVDEVIRILSRGSLPILRIVPGSNLDELHVSVEEATDNLNYVALSHVWADGLGNPYANSLPRCQLQLLDELLRGFTKVEHSEARGQGMYIWVDTLCCPVKPLEAKRLALSRMKTPYTEASHVLVLEASLRVVNALHLDPIEICLRIFTSGWMRRLWTLQEGALPQSLCFQFADSLLDLRHLIDKVIDIYNVDIGRRALALDMISQYRGLRNFFHARNGIEDIGIELVDQALLFRSVTVASDEPLLIGGLLNVDMTHILNGPEDLRMARLWSLIPSVPGGIPKNILFCRGPRLSQPGFRWAPASLLTFRGDHDGGLRSLDFNDNQGYLTSAGLRVRLPAFGMNMASVAKGLPKIPWNMFSQTDENTILGRNNDGIWFQIYGKYENSRDSNYSSDRPSLYNILRRDQPQKLLLATAFKFDGSSQTTDAVLVHEGYPYEKTPSVASDIIVNIGIKTGTSQTMLEAAYQFARLLLDDEITSKYNDLGISDEREQKGNPAYAELEAQLAQKLFSMTESIVDQDILNAIAANNSRGTKTFFPVMIASAYLGNFCELGTMLPSDTEWCVD